MQVVLTTGSLKHAGLPKMCQSAQQRQCLCFASAGGKGAAAGKGAGGVMGPPASKTPAAFKTPAAVQKPASQEVCPRTADDLLMSATSASW